MRLTPTEKTCYPKKGADTYSPTQPDGESLRGEAGIRHDQRVHYHRTRRTLLARRPTPGYPGDAAYRNLQQTNQTRRRRNAASGVRHKRTAPSALPTAEHRPSGVAAVRSTSSFQQPAQECRNIPARNVHIPVGTAVCDARGCVGDCLTADARYPSPHHDYVVSAEESTCPFS